MKKLCVLEQSGTIDTPYTAEKKALFQTDNCDYYRLNWRHLNDPDANLSAPGVLWSEGRSMLYDFVPKKYDYYMFMDDDISFHYKGEKSLTEKIIELLEEFRPMSANFYCERLWGMNPITKAMSLQKRAYPFLCLDLQLTIYSSWFADIVFPVPFHGSDKCMWYAYWLANKIDPGKQICFTEISITNQRSEPHFNQEIREYRNTLVKMFNRLTKDGSFDWDIEPCKQRNSELFNAKPEKGLCRYNLNDVREICDWESFYIKRRSPKRSLFHKLIVETQQRWIK